MRGEIVNRKVRKVSTSIFYLFSHLSFRHLATNSSLHDYSLVKTAAKAVLHHPHGRTPLRRISVLLRLTCPEFPIHAAAHPIILALIHTTAAAATPIFAALSSHPDHP